MNKLVKHQDFNTIKLFVQNKFNLWLFGQSGTGKSKMVELIASELQVPCYTFNCGYGTSFDELAGYLNLKNEITPGILWKNIDQECIILLDEIDLLEPKIQNQLNSLLETGELWIMSFCKKKHPNCIIVGTANTNGTDHNLSHKTRETADKSLLSRFLVFEVIKDHQMEKTLLKHIKNDENLVSTTNELFNEIDIFCKNNRFPQVYNFRHQKQICNLINHFDRFWIVDNWLSKLTEEWITIMTEQQCFRALLRFLQIEPESQQDFNNKQDTYRSKQTTSSIRNGAVGQKSSQKDDKKENGKVNSNTTSNESEFDFLGDE